MDWKTWLHGLLGAAIGGAATTVGAATGASVSGSPLDLAQIKGSAIGGAIIGAVLYLKQSPVPPDGKKVE